MTSLGAKIREIRSSRRWTQLEVAEAAGVSVSLIAALETGRRHYVTVEQLEGLARVLQVPTEALWAVIPGGQSQQRWIPLVAKSEKRAS